MDGLNVLVEEIRSSVTWVAGLADNIRAMTKLPIYYDDLCEINGYKISLARSGRILAYVYPTTDGFRLVSKAEWAKRTGIIDSIDRVDKIGWFGKPAAYWYVDRTDSESYWRVVRHLAKIAEVRYRVSRMRKPNWD